jgi:4-hydroxyphenylacetate 3-monooxygenase
MSKIDADSGQGIRNGKQYLEGLRDDRDVWIHGEKVDDVTSHPAMSRGAQTLAGFMDKQFDKELQDTITYEDNGKRYATSYMIPKSREDIEKRGKSFYEWATWSKRQLRISWRRTSRNMRTTCATITNTFATTTKS